jgi:hypothetical protein
MGVCLKLKRPKKEQIGLSFQNLIGQDGGDKVMKIIALINEIKVVTIESLSEKDVFRVYFTDYKDKYKSPEEWKKSPWGYDGYRVFLPPDVIKTKLLSIFPGIIFIDGDKREEVAA